MRKFTTLRGQALLWSALLFGVLSGFLLGIGAPATAPSRPDATPAPPAAHAPATPPCQRDEVANSVKVNDAGFVEASQAYHDACVDRMPDSNALPATMNDCSDIQIGVTTAGVAEIERVCTVYYQAQSIECQLRLNPYDGNAMWCEVVPR